MENISKIRIAWQQFGKIKGSSHSHIGGQENCQNPTHFVNKKQRHPSLDTEMKLRPLMNVVSSIDADS